MDTLKDEMLTPAAAAKKAQCGRSSIMRAVESFELKASRDNRNRWKISAQDLDAWMKKRVVTARNQPDTDRKITEAVRAGEADTALKLAAAEVKIEGLEARLRDTQADRDAWREQAQKLASEARQPVGILGRIFGRS